MSFSKVTTDVIVPILTSVTAIGLGYATYVIANKGIVSGAIATGALVLVCGLFLAHDVRRLFFR